MSNNFGWTRRDSVWLGVSAVGYAAALTFLLLWKSRTDQDWSMGSVPDWLTVLVGIGGLGTVFVAVRQLRAQEQRERRAQASRVYCRVEPQHAERVAGTKKSGEVHYVVNGSDEPIRNVGYIAVRADGTQELTHPLDKPLSPGEEAYVALYEYDDLPAGWRGVRASIPFNTVTTSSEALWDTAVVSSDGAGRSWIRMPNLVVNELQAGTTTRDVVDLVKRWRQDNPPPQPPAVKLQQREPQDDSEVADG